MLKLYDREFTLIADGTTQRSSHNGVYGGAYDILLYLKNDDAATYYTDITIGLADPAGSTGYLNEDGYYVKFLQGEDEPTEREWDLVLPGESIPLDDIGDADAADTVSYNPFWIRVYCPGNESAKEKLMGDVKIYYTESLV